MAKTRLLDRLKAMPRAQGKRSSFLDSLTPTQRKELLEIRKLRKAGQVTCSVKDIIATLKAEGYKLNISHSHMNNWLNDDA